MSSNDSSFIKKLGPGLITGAADDDPSGIATYSQAGSQFGFGMMWTLLISYPLMYGVQATSAKIGRVTGHGLATNIGRHYPRWLLYSMISLLLVANVINIAADLAAMGEAVNILISGPALVYALMFGLLSLVLEIFIPYKKYVRVLKWLTLALFAYVGTAFAVHIPWTEVARQIILPSISLQPEYVTTVVAVFGTTISPYLFFWQASQEVEDLRCDENESPLANNPERAEENLKRIKVDTLVGMGFSNAVAFFIMLTTAVTLHVHGGKEIQSAAEAASALRPVAGEFAFLLFSIGIIGTGLLSVPVLAGSAAYAIAGTFQWENSLERKPATAKRFYAIIAIATLLGSALCFMPIDPFKALYWAAVINGVIAVPIIVIMMLMATNQRVMGEFIVAGKTKLMGWSCAVVMAVSVVAMVAFSLM